MKVDLRRRGERHSELHPSTIYEVQSAKKLWSKSDCSLPKLSFKFSDERRFGRLNEYEFEYFGLELSES